MLTRQEAERLAAAINAIRPDWPVASLLSFLKKREARPLLDLSIELMWVATLPETKTPARMDEHGPWKFAVSNGGPTPLARYVAPDDCAICHGPRDGRHDDHEYREPLPSTEWARPTAEQRELMRLAAEKAQRLDPDPEPDLEQTRDTAQADHEDRAMEDS